MIRVPKKNVVINGFTFCFAKAPIYLTQFNGWNAFSIFDLSEYAHVIPSDVREFLDVHWRHVIHVAENSARPAFTRNTLVRRVNGGQILAYYYAEISIANVPCIYYGYLPTYNNAKDCTSADVRDNYYSRDKLSIACQKIWPSRLYAYIERVSNCFCDNERCCRVRIITRDHINGPARLPVNEYNYALETKSFADILQIEKRFALEDSSASVCIRRVKWDSIYLMLGDTNDDDKEAAAKFDDDSREVRFCKVCASCRKCANSPKFCRNHKICRHEKAILD